MTDIFRNFFTWLGVLTARPGAFFVIVIYAVFWLFFSPGSFEWHSGATLATWMMTVFIQRATHRDMQAVQAKLDHLLEKIDSTDGRLAGLDKMQPEDIETYRKDHTPV